MRARIVSVHPVAGLFTASHRAGQGPPLVCLHGFMDTWRTWELVLPRLERSHDVLAPTLPGHAGGPALLGPVTDAMLPDAVERAMDAAGFETAHIAGNSLGGHVALTLAARGRARSVVALAPAGGWEPGERSHRETFALQLAMHEQLQEVAAQADAIVASPEGRRRVSALIATNFEHIPAKLLAHLIRGAAGATAVGPLVEYAIHSPWPLDTERITCPVRIVWGTADRLLPWPSAAARFRDELLPNADWVMLDGIGHCPQLDVPLETAELIAGFAAG